MKQIKVKSLKKGDIIETRYRVISAVPHVGSDGKGRSFRLTLRDEDEEGLVTRDLDRDHVVTVHRAAV